MMSDFIFWIILNIESEEDQNFIAEINENYYNFMYKKAIEYVQNKYDAEDIVQKVIIKLIKKIPILKTFERHTLISYIVFTIKNTSLNLIKNRNKDSDSMFLYGDDEDVKNIPDDMDTPENIVLDKFTNETIHKAIDQLNPKYKSVIEYKYFKNMSDKEIAAIMNITSDYVRKCLERARKSLQKVLEQEGN